MMSIRATAVWATQMLRNQEPSHWPSTRGGTRRPQRGQASTIATHLPEEVALVADGAVPERSPSDHHRGRQRHRLSVTAGHRAQGYRLRWGVEQVGHGVGPVVPGAEGRLEGVGPLEEQVGVDLPRVAHAAVHLDAGLAVGEGRLGRGELGRGDGPLDRADDRVVEGDAGGVDRAAGHLGPGEHVGHQVLERLERADRTVELVRGPWRRRRPGRWRPRRGRAGTRR